MKPVLFTLLLANICANCAPYVAYSPTNDVHYRPDVSYSRDEYDWWVANTHAESRLSRNGVYQSSESGTNDIGMLAAWSIQPRADGVVVGVVDIADGHGRRMLNLVTNVASGCTLLFYNVGSYTPFNVAQGIDWMRTNGAQMIVIGYGTSANDAALSNACARTSWAGIPLLVPMREDGSAYLNVDSFPDYPSSYASRLPLVIPVSGTDRTGSRHPSCGYGTNSIAAPFRNIIADGNYESGTSYSAPIAGGCLALIAAKYPRQSAEAWTAALKSTARPVSGTRRIDPAVALIYPTPRLLMLNYGGMVTLTIGGAPEFVYTVEYSTDMTTWTDLYEVYGQTEIEVDPGFYRARIY